MLQLQNISKFYTTNAFTQVALDNVSVAFRDNEFVSILGPSGSGKTTMLNVIGGLDHFDEGDLLIDGISTKEYRDRDWDAYRNNRIGFVFQSYNLIPHQTVLANVELALTLSGVSPAERRSRARKALEDVGLGEHVDKRPSQLSGGQMQRVAIARALINDPEILLADEPTGALDSHTSVQVMDLLRKVAADRLVVMVTHNPELAHEYSTRIVELADGRICSDSNPFVPTARDMREARAGRHTSMSFLTALSLSFNNLMTKKGRTLMTAFAGSIGIIGIAAILALANGVNAYIQEVEEDTLSVYPLQIMSSGLDMTSMLVDVKSQVDEGEANAKGEGDSNVAETRMVTSMFGSVGKNDLASLKEFLDNDGGGIGAYVQDVEYLYGIVPRIYYLKEDGKAQQVNPDTAFESLGMGSSSSLMSSSSTFSSNVFSQMPADVSLLEDQFDMKAGHWPSKYDEMVLVLSRRGTISDYMSYALGIRDHQELEDMVRKFADQEEVEAPTDELSFTYEELMAREFRVVPASSLYEHESDYGVWTNKSDDKDFVSALVRKGQKLKIVGVVQPKEDVDATTITMGVYYTPKLTRWLMEQATGAKIVQEQLANPSINVISGKSFDSEAEDAGSDFNMSSLFSIDQDKLAEAFSIDASKMDLSGLDLSGMASALDLSSLAGSADLSGMDLSGMDLSSMDLSSLQLDLGDLDLSNIDLSDIDLSGVDLSGIDYQKLILDDLSTIMKPRMQNIDIAALFEGVNPSVDQQKIQPLISSTLTGLMGYLTLKGVDVSNPDAVIEAVSEYLSSPEVLSELLEGLNGAVSFSAEDQDRLAQNLLDQLTKVELTKKEQKRLQKDANKLVGVIVEQLGEQVGQQIGQKIAASVSSALQQQLSGALTQTIATALQSYMTQVMGTYFSQLAESLQTQLSSALSSTMQGAMEQLMSNMAGAMHVDEEVFAKAFQFNMDQQELSELMMSLLSTEKTSYEGNLTKLGYANEKKPSEIDVYPLNFDSKAEVISILDAYNDEHRAAGEDDKVITYTDIVGALMSSVTDIVNMISYVLIAFVAISLVVSSIMIGVITYISVLERKKEIGILRSIGASKRDISRVFNAETIIEGLVSGIMGVSITALGCIPANIIVEEAFDVERVARLPVTAALVLVGVSVFLSFVAGLIPSRKAAKADPVEALRSE